MLLSAANEVSPFAPRTNVRSLGFGLGTSLGSRFQRRQLVLDLLDALVDLLDQFLPAGFDLCSDALNVFDARIDRRQETHRPGRRGRWECTRSPCAGGSA